MLRQLLEGQKELRAQNTRLETKIETVEAQNTRLEGEVANLKRRLEEKDEEEEQNKKHIGEYYVVDVRADLAKNTAGIRATIYEVADHYNAVWYAKDALWSTERNGRILNVNLHFPSPSDARAFMGAMTELNHRWGVQREKLRCLTISQMLDFPMLT
jgi:regulator of replication initiation timing